jgi:hypothetical protein
LDKDEKQKNPPLKLTVYSSKPFTLFQEIRIVSAEEMKTQKRSKLSLEKVNCVNFEVIS